MAVVGHRIKVFNVTLNYFVLTTLICSYSLEIHMALKKKYNDHNNCRNTTKGNTGCTGECYYFRQFPTNQRREFILDPWPDKEHNRYDQ